MLSQWPSLQVTICFPKQFAYYCHLLAVSNTGHLTLNETTVSGRRVIRLGTADTKGKEKRVIPLSPPLQEILRRPPQAATRSEGCPHYWSYLYVERQAYDGGVEGRLSAIRARGSLVP